MIKKYNVLIVDDHPMIAEAYKNALIELSSRDQEITFKIIISHNCDRALEIIDNKNLDLVFLDIKLPPSIDGKILSGEDLGIKVNQILPEAKIIVSTTFNDNYRINSIIKNINPDGFLIKNDIDHNQIITAIKRVLNDPPYYSQTVNKFFRKQAVNEFMLDKIDRQLLYELSIGTKMKDLPDILPLSIAGIEKRKRHLKVIFNVEGQDDKALIAVARDKGFI